MSEKIYLIGVDVGTNGTKSSIFDSSGKLISESFEESKLYYPELCAVEQDLDEIYSSVINTIRDCVEKSNLDVSKVEGIAIDGQMAGTCAIESDWSPATPYDSWLDTRCGPYIEVMKKEQSKIISVSGGPPSFNHGPKMLWWKNERPEVFKKIAKFIMPSAYVAGKMAGLKASDAYIDHTFIHFSCFSDILNKKWSEELCGHFGLPMDKLPRIIRPWEIIGGLTKKAAGEASLIEGTPIAAGCGDTIATMLGAAFTKVGMVFDVAGTASVFAVCLDKFKPDVKNKTFFTARHAPEDLWYSIAYINGGGLNLRWFRDEIIKFDNNFAGKTLKDSYKYLDNLASEIKAGSEKLFFIPHIGGRVCPNSPYLKGGWIGLSWKHKIGHLYRSLLEAVAYEYAIYRDIEKELVPEIKFEKARVIGGGARSELWNRIKSSILGIPYERLAREEFGVLGSSILAGYAAGVFDDLKSTADRFNEVKHRIEPDKEMQKFYGQYVSYYKFLLQNVDTLFEELEKVKS
jgi:xylulokinase